MSIRGKIDSLATSSEILLCCPCSHAMCGSSLKCDCADDVSSIPRLIQSSPAMQSASDVYAPASGEVLEVNSSLVEDPSLVRHAVLPHSPCVFCSPRTASVLCM